MTDREDKYGFEYDLDADILYISQYSDRFFQFHTRRGGKDLFREMQTFLRKKGYDANIRFDRSYRTLIVHDPLAFRDENEDNIPSLDLLEEEWRVNWALAQVPSLQDTIKSRLETDRRFLVTAVISAAVTMGSKRSELAVRIAFNYD